MWQKHLVLLYLRKIYKTDLSGATDISDTNNTATGKLFDGKTAEELKDAATLAKYTIKPVQKTMVADFNDWHPGIVSAW